MSDRIHKKKKKRDDIKTLNQRNQKMIMDRYNGYKIQFVSNTKKRCTIPAMQTTFFFVIYLLML